MSKKKILLYILGILCMGIIAGSKPAEAKEMEKNEQKSITTVYTEILMEHVNMAKEEGVTEQPRFSLIYLDEDVTPELVVICGTAHPDGGYVYSYENGNVVAVGDSEEWMGYGEYGNFNYVEKKAFFWNSHEGFGNVYDSICKWEGENVTVFQEFECLQTVNGEEVHQYKVDGCEVSSEEFYETYEIWNQENEKQVFYPECYTIPEIDIEVTVENAWKTLKAEQADNLHTKLMTATGCTTEESFVFDYDDYDNNGHYEAFAIYEGQLWFADAESCEQVSHNTYNYYDIDGKITGAHGEKAIYLYTDRCATSILTDIWKVENGTLVMDQWSGVGQVMCTEDMWYDKFVLVCDAYDSYYDAEMEMMMGHTWKPYFYTYNNGKIEPYDGEEIAQENIENICGFELAKEIEKEGYEIGKIYLWEDDIVTINYSIQQADGSVRYENIVWDCHGGDDQKGDYYYLPGSERPAHWKEAGYGGNYVL